MGLVLNPITGKFDVDNKRSESWIDDRFVAHGTDGQGTEDLLYVQFDIDGTPITNAEGLLQWNATDGTLDLGMSEGEITMQIGQELFAKVRNASGYETISNGQVVYISGRTGVYPDVQKARSDAVATSRILGVATQDIASPGFGYITTFGYVRGIKTDYSGAGIWGTTWVTGDLLYVSSTVAGQLTNVEPDIPHHSDIVGTVGVISSNQGSILVTNTKHYTITELTDVNGTALTTNGQLIVWDNDNSFFDFTNNINDYLPLAGGTMTGQLLIDLGSDTQGIVIQGDASQTANLQEWQDSAGNVLSGVDERGVLFSNGGSDISHTFIGSNAGNINAGAGYSVAIGEDAMPSITTGFSNVAIGKLALFDLTEAYHNTAIGYNSLANITTTGIQNFGLGSSAGVNNTSGSNNVYIGFSAGFRNSTGSNLIYIGYRAGYSSTVANNIAIGSDALYGVTNQTTGQYNVAIGYKTMNLSTTGHSNIAIGYEAGKGLTTGQSNFTSGYQAGLGLSTGNYNVGIGNSALYAIAGGNNNIGIGYFALKSMVTKNSNIAIGTFSMSNATNVQNNVAIGNNNLQGATTGGNNNTAIGISAGGLITSGGSNIFLGYQAGYRQTTNSNLFIVDNQQRASQAVELTNAILYGVMDASPTNQTLRINADITVNAYERHVQIPVLAVGLPANQPTAVDVGTAGGYQFASSGTQEELHFQWEIPDDWDGTDIKIEIDWLPDSGAMTNPDAVSWVFEYRAVAEGESILSGTQATQTVTYNTTTAQYVTVHSPVTLPFNDANQPLTKQDHLYVRCYRDTAVANDFSGTVVATAFEVLYNSIGLPTSN